MGDRKQMPSCKKLTARITLNLTLAVALGPFLWKIFISLIRTPNDNYGMPTLTI